jgi:CTP:molybdopterin cytidylyltransferase MocA
MKLCNAKIIFPTVEGRKKHPPLIRVELLEEIYNYQGNMGLRGALELYETDTISLEVGDYGCTIDTDTPGDYKRLLEYGK